MNFDPNWPYGHTFEGGSVYEIVKITPCHPDSRYAFMAECRNRLDPESWTVIVVGLDGVSPGGAYRIINKKPPFDPEHPGGHLYIENENQPDPSEARIVHVEKTRIWSVVNGKMLVFEPSGHQYCFSSYPRLVNKL